MDNLIDIEMSLEDESLGLGIKRYHAQREKDETKVRPGQRLLVESLQPLSKAVKEWIENTRGKNVSRNLALAYVLEEVESPDTIAYITSKAVINGMARRSSLATVARGIAAQLEDAINFDKLKEEEPGLHKQLMSKIAKSSDAGYRHGVMRKQLKFAALVCVKWGTSERLRLGLHLIDIMQKTVTLNGNLLFTMSKPVGAGKDSTLIVPTPSTFEWLKGSHAHCEMLSPVFMPMVVPPKPWVTPIKGGYLHHKLQRPLVKAKGRSGYMEELHNTEMPEVYSSVNALQETPWAINTAVMAVMEQVWDEGSTLGGLPSSQLQEIPARCHEDATKEQVKERNGRAARVYEENIKQESKRLAQSAKLSIAKRFSEYESIYFVHTLDWRGRAYPSASYVNPQSDDAGKSLLRFANGCPLGDNGAYWLAVHGANSYGVDKCSFDERVQWVLDHEAQILEAALNPLDGSRFWAIDAEGKTTDSPYVFLAFCFEWAGYVMGGRRPEYVSYLPVAFDGSCNGLQNYSMMLRDEVGGAATNLVPSGTPSDIYTQVANAAQDIVNQHIQEGIVEAQAWVGKVVRKISKQPTMTMPYGASQFGYREQILTAIKKATQDAAGLPYLGEADPYKAAGYLAKVIGPAIAQVVVKASEAMGWLRECATLAAQEKLPVRWTAPSGFPVLQDYRETIGEVFKATVSGTRIELTLTRDGDELSKRKQSQGIAPNFIHSCDAAHMMRTVNGCLSVGITSFAMVHDSYGTHAGNAEVLSYELRRAFVEQYSGDILERFRGDLMAQLSPDLQVKLPPVPSKGTLDPAAVMHSEYFFA